VHVGARSAVVAPKALLAVLLVALGAAAAVAAPDATSLGGACVVMRGAGVARCRAAQPRRETLASDNFGYADFAAGYSLYRLVSATDQQRRCRLQPTCSLFAARAARRFGLLRGLLMGLARAQMEHSDQGGLLPRAVASDGQFIYFDPIQRWDHTHRDHAGQ
jgi:hypothetical protein